MWMLPGTTCDRMFGQLTHYLMNVEPNSRPLRTRSDRYFSQHRAVFDAVVVFVHEMDVCQTQE